MSANLDDMRHVKTISPDKHKVRMVVPPALIQFVQIGNLTRVIEEPDLREARAKINQTIGEFEAILADARRQHRGEPEPRYSWPRDPLQPFGAQIRRSPPPPEYVESVSRINDEIMKQHAIGMRRLRGEKVESQIVSFDTILDQWKTENKPEENSIVSFQLKMEELGRWLGHSNMRPVSRQQLLDYKAHLLKFKGSNATVRGHIGAIKALWAFALDNGRIDTNEAARISLPPFKSERRPFTDEERLLLLERSRSADPCIRWPTWISSFSGCRLSEIARAHKFDIRQEGEYVVLYIRKDNRPPGQNLKTEDSKRRFPLHGSVLQEGFLDYWSQLAPGPLFAFSGNPSRVIGRWIRKIGITDPHAVFHSHRHTFLAPAHLHYAGARGRGDWW
jgi:integrase